MNERVREIKYIHSSQTHAIPSNCRTCYLLSEIERLMVQIGDMERVNDDLRGKMKRLEKSYYETSSVVQDQIKQMMDYEKHIAELGAKEKSY